MKNSNLAERLEEFAATVRALDSAVSKTPPALTVISQVARPAPRRLSLSARRIQIRDQGLRPFRVS